jgi:hypothetical protein
MDGFKMSDGFCVVPEEILLSKTAKLTLEAVDKE